MSELETWTNVTPSRHVLKFNKGGEIIEKMIGPEKTFHISPEERRLNQELAATPALDVFQNGVMSPVTLIESTDDYTEIASNPNLMTEDDMRSLVKAHYKTFDARLEEISNPLTLKRLVEIAREEDASVRKVDALVARYEAVRPDAGFVTEVEYVGNIRATRVRPGE